MFGPPLEKDKGGNIQDQHIGEKGQGAHGDEWADHDEPVEDDQFLFLFLTKYLAFF